MARNTPESYPEYLRITETPEAQQWVKEGRLVLPNMGEKGKEVAQQTDAYRHVQDVLNAVKIRIETLKAEDKKLNNLFELANDRPPTQEERNKLAPYADDPASLERAISKITYKEPVTEDMSGQAADLIKTQLGREATPEEAEHFGKLLQQGTIDAYTLNQFLTQTPEYMEKASATEQDKLKTMLASSDEQYLQQAAKTIQSRYAQAGRPYAGAVGAQMAQEGAKLAANRGQYLAGLQYADYQRGLGTLQQNYMNLLGQQQANLAATQGLGAESRNRYYGAQDFYRQLAGQQSLLALQNAYANASKPSFLEGIVPGIIQAAGTVAGAAVGGPPGAVAGNAAGNAAAKAAFPQTYQYGGMGGGYYG